MANVTIDFKTEQAFYLAVHQLNKANVRYGRPMDDGSQWRLELGEEDARIIFPELFGKPKYKRETGSLWGMIILVIMLALGALANLLRWIVKPFKR